MKTRQRALFFVGACVKKLLETVTKVGSHAAKETDQTPKDLHCLLLSPLWALQVVVSSIFGVGIM